MCNWSIYYQHLAEIVWQLNICTIIGLITHEFDLSLYMWQDVLDTTLWALWSSCSWLVVIMSFFRVLQFPPPIKLNPIILLKLALNILKSYIIFRIFVFCCWELYKTNMMNGCGIFFYIIVQGYLLVFVCYHIHGTYMYYKYLPCFTIRRINTDYLL